MNLELPRPGFALVAVTQVLLALLFLVGAGAVSVLPAISLRMAESFPEYEPIRVRLLVIGIAFAVLGLAAVAVVSLLVNRVRRGTVLRRSSVRLVNVLVGTLLGAVALVVAGSVVVSIGQAGSPPLMIVTILTFLTLATLASITLVLRSLLRRATMLSDELDEVV